VTPLQLMLQQLPQKQLQRLMIQRLMLLKRLLLLRQQLPSLNLEMHRLLKRLRQQQPLLHYQ
jgi:hypothetical protein